MTAFASLNRDFAKDRRKSDCEITSSSETFN